MRSLSFFILMIFFTSCSEKTADPSVYINHGEFEKEPLSVFFEIENLTCLNKKNRPILGQLDKLVEFDDKYFILDRFMNREIYVFNKTNGNFLFKIGHNGEGPGGYNLPYDFQIDKRHKTVEVLVPGKMMIYDMEGKYMAFKELSLPAVRFQKSKKGYSFVLGSRKPQLAITNNNLETVDTFFPFSTMHAMLPDNSFVQLNEKLLFHRNFENTIYEISQKGLKKHIEFEFDQSKITNNDKKKINNPDEVYEKFANKKLGFKFYLESEDYVLFPYIYRQEAYLYIKNKHTGNEKLFDIANTSNDLTYENSFPMPLSINEKGNLLCYLNLGTLTDFSLIERMGCQEYMDFAIVEIKIKI